MNNDEPPTGQVAPWSQVTLRRNDGSERVTIIATYDDDSAYYGNPINPRDGRVVFRKDAWRVLDLDIDPWAVSWSEGPETPAQSVPGAFSPDGSPPPDGTGALRDILEARNRNEELRRGAEGIHSDILAEGHARCEAATTPEQRAQVMARAFVGALGDLAALEPAARGSYLPELALALEVDPDLADTVKWLMNLEEGSS